MPFVGLEKYLYVTAEDSPKVEVKPTPEIKGEEENREEEIPPSYLVSAGYCGSKGVAKLKFYDPETQKIFVWYDNTGHKPYLLTNLTVEELKKLDAVMNHPGLDHLETVKKYDPLSDREITVTKVVAKDPLSIGGRGKNTLRDLIPKECERVFGSEKKCRVWESYIKYYQSYLYDRNLIPGMKYKTESGKLVQVSDAQEDFMKDMEKVFLNEPKEFLGYVIDWARLLEAPAPKPRILALDIEVLAPVIDRIPDPREAAHPVIAVALVGNDGKKRMLLLKREEIKQGSASLPEDLKVEFYSSEKELLKSVFEALKDYPFVLTFNGDEFDLRYLWHRALNLGFKKEEIPIEATARNCLLEYGIHIDLYKFFFNRSIQTYAFRHKYHNATLDDVSSAILGEGKVQLGERSISELTYTELARYCSRDAELLLELSSFNDGLVIKLILILSRISKMTLEDVSRQGVSRWIRSLFYYEHRRRGMLIPNKEDILEIKGATATKAVIKGKKYKGAIVVEPEPGIHFNVLVLDFASLYPSIIKEYNLGYQTLLCPHPECRDNTVPGTPHWICRKNRSIESLIIGSLRDLRVKWYKPKSKSKDLEKDLKSWYDVVQQALKVILNASYGVFGAETFDLYCPPVAESTAAIGRDAITKTIKKAEELGIRIIYGDTDSVFIKNPTEEQVRKLIEWSEKDLKLGLEVDKEYRYAVFSSRKKNYLGVYKDGRVEAKGLTGIKRHIPAFLERAFEEVLKALSEVNTEADFKKAKTKIEKIVRECYLKLKRREYPLEDLAYQVVLGKSLESYVKTTPQHVKAALLLQKSGEKVEAGEVIRFVKTVGEDGVKPLKLASKSEVDVNKYIGDVRTTFSQILDPLGMNFDEIIGFTRLEYFM